MEIKDAMRSSSALIERYTTQKRPSRLVELTIIDTYSVCIIAVFAPMIVTLSQLVCDQFVTLRPTSMSH